jgi:hypothetical protein
MGTFILPSFIIMQKLALPCYEEKKKLLSDLADRTHMIKQFPLPQHPGSFDFDFLPFDDFLPVVPTSIISYLLFFFVF